VEPKLLLDENLSPRVALALQGDGIDVVHIRDRKGLGSSDRAVLERAFKEDRILVTANVADFAKLAHAAELHAGIVLIEDGALLFDEQLQLLRQIVERLRGEDMANRLLSVNAAGKSVFEDVPP
jgi:predicted nuclease of predicted toxin-antitoxin system